MWGNIWMLKLVFDLLLAEVFGLVGAFLLWKLFERMPKPTPEPRVRDRLPYFGGAAIAIALTVFLSWCEWHPIMAALSGLLLWRYTSKIIHAITKARYDAKRKKRIRELSPG